MLGFSELTEGILGAAIEVHRQLGPGLLESAYSACLRYELQSRGFEFEAEKRLPLAYKGIALDCGYRLDLVVEKVVVVEIKAIERIEKVHEAQVLSYLRISGCTVGLLINFNVPVLRQGIRRIVLNCPEPNLRASASPR
jgi:GxxExxY protein